MLEAFVFVYWICLQRPLQSTSNSIYRQCVLPAISMLSFSRKLWHKTQKLFCGTLVFTLEKPITRHIGTVISIRCFCYLKYKFTTFHFNSIHHTRLNSNETRTLIECHHYRQIHFVLKWLVNCENRTAFVFINTPKMQTKLYRMISNFRCNWKCLQTLLNTLVGSNTFQSNFCNRILCYDFLQSWFWNGIIYETINCK